MFQREIGRISAWWYVCKFRQTNHTRRHTAYTQNKAILAQPLVSSIKRWELNLQRLLVIITMGKC